MRIHTSDQGERCVVMARGPSLEANWIAARVVRFGAGTAHSRHLVTPAQNRAHCRAPQPGGLPPDESGHEVPTRDPITRPVLMATGRPR